MGVAIVTGASRGLGEALATGLAGAGWSLVVDGRDPVTLDAAATSIRAAAKEGARIAVVVGDVTDGDHRRDLTAAASELGGLDLVVNNAGTLGTSPLPTLADYPLDDLRIAFEVNVVAPLGLLQDALPLLLRAPRPRGRQRDVGRRRGGLRGLGRLRRRQGGPRAPRRRAGRRVTRPHRVVGGSRRPAHGDAPGGVSRARTSQTGPSRPRWCRRSWS